MRRVLIVHALSKYMRQTTFEFVMSFARYAPANVMVEHRNIRDVEFFSAPGPQVYDAVLITYDVLGLRSTQEWEWVLAILDQLRDSTEVMAAFPQDDYTCNEILDEGLHRVGVDVIYSPVGCGLDTLYPLMSSESEIRHALTGYVDEATAALRMGQWRPHGSRPIDIGTRVTMLAPWLGRIGRRKGLFAALVAERLDGHGLRIDISTRDEDVFAGGAWTAFLASCRATIGQLGGASLCDPTGEIAATVTTFLDRYPDASFEKIEAACFAGLDSQVEMTAISPRLFDAAMVGTAQVLIEDHYLDVLEPWVHYIPTDYKLSNLEEVVDALGNPARTESIARAAAEVLINSGEFTYRSFVGRIIDECTGGPIQGVGTRQRSLRERMQWRMTADLFESVQHLGYLGRIYGGTSELESLAERVAVLAKDHPEVIPHLTNDLMVEIDGWSPLPGGFEHLAGPLIDVLRECTLSGVIEHVPELFRVAADPTTSEWTCRGWTGGDQARLTVLAPS